MKLVNERFAFRDQGVEISIERGLSTVRFTVPVDTDPKAAILALAQVAMQAASNLETLAGAAEMLGWPEEGEALPTAPVQRPGKTAKPSRVPTTPTSAPSGLPGKCRVCRTPLAPEPAADAKTSTCSEECRIEFVRRWEVTSGKTWDDTAPVDEAPEEPESREE